MSPHSRGLWLTQFNAFCAAMAFVTGSLVLQHTSAWRFTALNYLVAVVCNTLWWWLTHTGHIPRMQATLDPAYHGASARITGRGWLWLLAHTLSSAAGFMLMWWSFDLIPAHVGAILSRIEAVIGVLLGVWLLRETFTRRQWLGVPLALAGALVIRWTVLEGEPLGFLLALGGAIGFGIAEVTGKLAVRHVPVPRLVLIRAWIMCALLCATSWLVDPGWPTLPASIWAWLVVSALLGPFLSRNAYMLALTYLPVSQVVMLNQTNPLYAALGAMLLLGEEPGWRTLAGGALIVAGVVFTLVGATRRPPAHG